MKLLHIDSSILGDNSASRQLTAAVVSAWKASNPAVEVTYHDLAGEAIEHFSATSLPGAATSNTLEEFLAADAVVIGAPMYNFSIPSQLKAWIDRIAVAGKTFRYTEAGAEGLCGGKKVIVVSTSGGLHVGEPSGVGHEEYLKVMLGFMGITDIQFVRAHGLAYGPEMHAKGMQEAQDSITERLFVGA